MRYLRLSEVLEIHRRVLAQSGGADGVRDLGAIQSALTQPQMTFGGEELYPTVEANIERDLLFVGVEPPVH